MSEQACFGSAPRCRSAQDTTGDPLEEVKQHLRLRQIPGAFRPTCPTKSYLVVEPSVQPVRVVLRTPALLLTPLPHLRQVVINPGEVGQNGFIIPAGWSLQNHECSYESKSVTV